MRGEGESTDAQRNGLADALMAFLEFRGAFFDLAAKRWLQRGPVIECGVDQLSFLGHRNVGVGLRLGKQPQGLVVRQPFALPPLEPCAAPVTTTSSASSGGRPGGSSRYRTRRSRIVVSRETARVRITPQRAAFAPPLFLQRLFHQELREGDDEAVVAAEVFGAFGCRRDEAE